MARTHDRITGELARFIAAQPVFFVATAPLAADGHVNLSPKGLDTFAVLDGHTVAYLDLTGSGVETIAHLRENGRITIMFCAFEGPPRILRLHGRGEVLPAGTPAFDGLAARLARLPGARSVVRVAVERVSTSCGYGVPLMALDGQRADLVAWAERRGEDGIVRYRRERNAVSLDGLPGVPEAGPGS
ncbi:MAG: pyridoxamine 5'-phosphate oxidase family protein [Acidimicrobiia bacterium]|nr:pyridoxamine 5'-phosphate oxidase family protein [Acidimicrobiia bacterium]